MGAQDGVPRPGEHWQPCPAPPHGRGVAGSAVPLLDPRGSVPEKRWQDPPARMTRMSRTDATSATQQTPGRLDGAALLSGVARSVSGRGPERTTAAALAVVGAFQAALAAGAPWGAAAYGGSRRGVLPGRLRAASGASAAAYGTGAVLVLRGTGTPRGRRRAFTALSLLMGVGALVNGASRSPVERALWTPLTVVAAVSSWRSRPTS